MSTGQKLRTIRAQLGTILGQTEAWLLMRGMRTLFPRVAWACRSAQTLAERLAAHPMVAEVLYPGLPSFAGHAAAKKQMTGGFGGMLSVRVKGGERAAIATAARVELWKRATSLGGVESLIEHRASIEGPGTPCPTDLLRLSVGVEEASDLFDDLDQALRAAQRLTHARATSDELLVSVRGQETLAQRIVVVEAKARFAGLMGAAADFDDHRLASADRRRLAHDAAAEDAPVQLSNRRSSPSRASRRAICRAMRAVTPLPVGLRSIWRPAKMQTLRLGRVRAVAAVGQDGAVEEGEVGLVGMLDRHGLRRRLGDLLAGIDDGAHRRRPQIEADRIGGQEGIEGAAIGDVDRHRSPGARRRDAVERIGEGRHALEAHRAVGRDPRGHQAAGTLQAHDGLGLAAASRGRCRPPSAPARSWRGRTSSSSPRCA